MVTESQDNQNKDSSSVEQSVLTEKQQAEAIDFPVVGIGASAGGLEAFEVFFKACPADTGMAYVLVSHLSPDHHSMLSEILQRSTSMPVAQAIDQNLVAPNHVYIIPPNRDLALLNGVLQLSQPEQAHGMRLPIDGFFRSMAVEQAERAIGIILSGTGSDGTLGLRAILDAGGVCMVQTPKTAKFDGMPQSAINAGYVTHVIDVEAMPAMLQKLARMSIYCKKVPKILTSNTLSDLNQILFQIRSSTGHDFLLYKKNTILRRIERRMAQNNLKDMSVYARFLKKNPIEMHSLFKDLLINVTSFFRDEEAFNILKKDILPALLADKSDDYVFRVWVAGCSSGEEAYSIAIVLRELMDEMHNDFKVQIYATDLDEGNINTARKGRYLVDIEKDVTPERLKRFFTKELGVYKIIQDIRDMIVFAVQSVIKDPPFSNLDLLSCRNLLIYLEQKQQNQLFPVFYFALNPDGVLFLSSSESIPNDLHQFKNLNRNWKFYQAIKPEKKLNFTPTQFGNISMKNKDTLISKPTSDGKEHAIKVADLSSPMLLQSSASASVTPDVLELEHDGLQSTLRVALQSALQGEPTLSHEVTVKTKKGVFRVNFSVRLLSLPTSESNAEERLLLNNLEKDHQLGIIEAQKVTNEELNAMIEELQSANEELQSTNEELETSKEELQSLNEEILSVNTELNDNVEQLSLAQNDLKNLMDNVSNGILFLDKHLKIRSYTSEVAKVFRIIEGDVGRPLGDIVSNLQSESLLAEIQKVLETLIPFECEVQTNAGNWYLVRTKPYRTLDNVIDGVVISFSDVDALHKATNIKLNSLQLVKLLSQGIVDTVVEPLIVLNSLFQVISASRSFYNHFMVTSEETVGHTIFSLGNGQWDIPALRLLLEDILPKHLTIEGFEMTHNFPMLGVQSMVLNARRIKTELGDTELILLAMVIVESKS